jgi:hypothetical protein
MKLKYILPILLITLFASCESDDDTLPQVSETEGLQKVQELSNANHTIEVFTKSGEFYTGYNDISIRIKNNADDTYFETYTIDWMPMMDMGTMNHSCPKSNISKVTGKSTLYNGYLIYQMTALDASGWSLKFMYTIDNVDYMVEEDITVLQSSRQNVTTFTGSDSVKYIAAIIEPTTPEIAVNDLKVGLYKMESMMLFPTVADYTIGLDPRMPSMGNHSSPNNTDLTYNTEEAMYHGDLSLTMTGYWVLNLKLIDTENTVLKGEDITDDHTQSSLYLEIEF